MLDYIVGAPAKLRGDWGLDNSAEICKILSIGKKYFTDRRKFYYEKR
jgi:hypothetical protein